MSHKTRNAIAHWTLVVAAVALAALRLPMALPPELYLEAVTLALVVATLLNLGLPMTYGASTFVPVAALMAYLSFGRALGLWVAVAGLAIGGIALYVRAARRRDPQAVWWVELGGALWPLAMHSLCLWTADFAYRALGASPPLTEVPTFETVLPILASGVLYLLALNLLTALDVWLAGRRIVAFFLDNRRVLLAGQVLPLPLAPVAAITLSALGGPAFIVLALALLTIGVVVNSLVTAQGRLRRQVRQLTSFSSVSEAVRTSLKLNELLDMIYRQVAHLLDVEDFYVALLDPDTNQILFPFVVRDGRREARPRRERGNTFVEWVIDQQQPLRVVDDVEQTAQRMGLDPLEGGLQTWMGVPLKTPERTLGCMAVYRVGDGRGLFGEEDEELFGNLATQASVAVENALLYQDAQQHARQLATLNEISAVMNASLNPDKVLNLLSLSIIQVADCDKAAIYLLEDADETATLQLAHSEGFSEKFAAVAETITVPLSDKEREAVLETGELVAVPDIRAKTADVSPGLVALAEREKFRAYANFPLRAHGRTIGLLGVYYDTPNRFKETELELLQTFANQAALAVANARQYTVTDRALTRRVEQIVSLAEINRRLSATLDLDRVFHLVVDVAMDSCNALAAMLLVADEDDGKVRIGSWRGYPPDVIQRWQRSERATGIPGRVWQTGQTALVDDVSRDPDYINMGIGTKSLLSMPMLLDQEVLGIITLESDEEAAFSDEDVAFVGQLAVQAGGAIKNAQLYREVGEVNDRLRAILDASSDGLLMLDTQGRIVMTNTRMESFWDFARKEVGEKPVDAFLEDPLSGLGEGLGYGEGELKALVAKAVRSPEMPEQEDLYVVEEPSPRFVERSTRPVHDEFGSTIGLLLVFRDVTEQKELEEARENLANMIVHDLRNPLTAVLASLTLVQNTVVDRDESGVAKQATDISSRAVRKLLVMVNNLLDLGRLEAGEATPDQKPTAVSKMVENAVGEMLPLAMEMEVTMRVASETLDSLPQVNVDQDMIERVVLNLLDNALKFSPPGSEVTLRAELLEAEEEDVEADEDEDEEAEPEPPMVQIEVTDSGPGVPDEYKTRIFERYQQVRGQKGRRRGTGLGLAFCRMAVDAHGGRIWVEDAPGEEGSVFRLTLPVASEADLLD